MAKLSLHFKRMKPNSVMKVRRLDSINKVFFLFWGNLLKKNCPRQSLKIRDSRVVMMMMILPSTKFYIVNELSRLIDI